MIFNLQTKGYQTRLDKPDVNWTNDNSYMVIPDGSELAKKIKAHYPWFNMVFEAGVLVDVVPTDPEPTELTIETQIADLKARLDATDYKIIKCSEYQLAGLDMPYDIEALHTERQSLRDRINELTTVLEGE